MDFCVDFNVESCIVFAMDFCMDFRFQFGVVFGLDYDVELSIKFTIDLGIDFSIECSMYMHFNIDFSMSSGMGLNIDFRLDFRIRFAIDFSMDFSMGFSMDLLRATDFNMCSTLDFSIDFFFVPNQAQLVLRWETTWEHWVLYAFLFALFRHPPAVHPTSPLQSASSPPSQPAAHMAHLPLRAAMLPAAPFHAVLSSFQDMGDLVGSARS